MVSRNDFRSAMGRFATGVTVVTTLDEAGDVHGMTANSFTSVCLEPPAILVCVAHNARTYNYVESKGTFGVNVLGVDQLPVGQYFARRPEDRTEEIDWSYSTSGDGVPLLDGSMVSMACRGSGLPRLRRPHNLRGLRGRDDTGGDRRALALLRKSLEHQRGDQHRLAGAG